jgi:hypothetical protein
VSFITVWQCISPEVTVKGFKKCCMSIAVEGIDDGMLWNGSEEDGYVRSDWGKIKTLTEDGERDTDW